MKIKYELQNKVSKTKEILSRNLKTIVLGIIIVAISVGGFVYIENQRKTQEQSNYQLKQEFKNLLKDSNEKIQEQLKQQDKKIEEAKIVKAERLRQQSLASARVPMRSVSGGCEQFRPLVARYNWNVDIALAVMKAESGCNPTASHLNSNGSVDHGLMQLNNINVTDPAENIRIAYEVKYSGKDRFGNQLFWNPWTVCKTIVRCA